MTSGTLPAARGASAGSLQPAMPGLRLGCHARQPWNQALVSSADWFARLLGQTVGGEQ